MTVKWQAVEKIRFFGDVHGDVQGFDQYLADLPTGDNEYSVQVGDFGAGFVKLPDLPIQNYFIRGNHDDPAIAKGHPNYIPDGSCATVFDGVTDTKIMFIGGAASIDKAKRTEGKDWWRDEEISYPDFMDILEIYNQFKPDIMITHDCPEEVSLNMKRNEQTRTRQALQVMFENHKPKFWIFGHYHCTFRYKQKGTQFICVPKNEYIDLIHDNAGNWQIL